MEGDVHDIGKNIVAVVMSCNNYDVVDLGICLGMQIAVIEFARDVLNFSDANSTEFNEQCNYPVIDLMKDQEGVILGGTMRLGKYPCKIKEGTVLHNAYKTDLIYERHRHRYEFNNKFKTQMEQAGLVIGGMDGLYTLHKMQCLFSHDVDFCSCSFGG